MTCVRILNCFFFSKINTVTRPSRKKSTVRGLNLALIGTRHGSIFVDQLVETLENTRSTLKLVVLELSYSVSVRHRISVLVLYTRSFLKIDAGNAKVEASSIEDRWQAFLRTSISYFFASLRRNCSARKSNESSRSTFSALSHSSLLRLFACLDKELKHSNHDGQCQATD